LTPFVIIDNFMHDASLIDEARSELTAMFDSQQCFRTAEQLASIRNDELCWLPTDPADYKNRNFSAPLVQVIEALRGLCDRIHLSPDAEVKLTNPRHIQAAVYSTAGAHYSAHRDNKPRSQRNVDDDALWLSNPDQRNRHLTTVPDPLWVGLAAGRGGIEVLRRVCGGGRRGVLGHTSGGRRARAWTTGGLPQRPTGARSTPDAA
jgi:hypothetical protein